ncbi:hypothetical protein [Haliangium ochraceum]|uniref:Uncharacterized protein n=1 Tax=Haliangium ochraceum (strain DSM 14365 / JCM 11303 / SMP-2) TaxID=502025 RepID=D0LH94_HALO1|nr:hypothetical protein [Haliangium ochraceum]ACY18239.1 hypothetical protein Hoch_5762 [Haliangium ochraceum DSM 14365]
MQETMATQAFPQTAAFHASLPKKIYNSLRHVLEATAPPDTFSCLCSLLETVAKYIDNLCNSLYAAGGVEQEALEQYLRPLRPNVLSFGQLIGGIREFARYASDFEALAPDIAEVLSTKDLPSSCVRVVKTFKIIKTARDRYEIPVHRLEDFLESQLAQQNLSKVKLYDYLLQVVEFRNPGVGHRSDDSWFPQDPRFYALLNHYLSESIDDLLSWGPLQQVLTTYEVVEAQGEVRSNDPAVTHTVTRPQILEGRAPLGLSYLRFGGKRQVHKRILARRTEHPAVLEQVVPYTPFPTTLQSPEVLHQRYRHHYLMTYIDRGVITPSQRQDDLLIYSSKLGIPEKEVSKSETKICSLVDRCSGEENDAGVFVPDDLDAFAELLQFTGIERKPEIENRIVSLIEQLPRRRKDYIYQVIENNFVTSFAQLQLESELSETDLTDVLNELEGEDGRIRRVDASGSDSKPGQSYFKVQDSQKLHTFQAILSKLASSPPPSQRYPAAWWELLDLSKKLLSDDGFEISKISNELLDSLRGHFTEAGMSPDASTATSDDDAPMEIVLAQNPIRAHSVRSLLTRVWDELARTHIDTSPVIPFSIGRTRYLLNSRPYHANDTPFATPIEHKDVYFEANLTRSQTLNEIMRMLATLGVEASSPNVEVEHPPTTSEVDGLDEEHGNDAPVAPIDAATDSDIGQTNTLELVIEDPSGENEETVTGTTVRTFFINLMTYLLERGIDLSTVTPFAAGRVRYLLAEEPYHANGRRFQAVAKKDGYFMEAAFPHTQAITHARRLCETLALKTAPLSADEYDDGDQLVVVIGGEEVRGTNVPEFFEAAVKSLFRSGILTDADIPYKSGRIRNFIAHTPDHGEDNPFIRAVQVDIDGVSYFIEAHLSRQGALERIRKLLEAKAGPEEDDSSDASSDVAGDDE